MDALLVPAGGKDFPLRGSKLDAEGIAADPVLADMVRAALSAFTVNRPCADARPQGR